MRRIHLTSLVAVCITLSSLTLLGACSRLSQIHEQSGSTVLSPRPRLGSRFDHIIVGAGESITIRNAPADMTQYSCVTGRPLSCSGYGRRRYCFCPRER